MMLLKGFYFTQQEYSVEFEKTPDYHDWGNQFRNLFFEKSHKYHYKYDWVVNDDIANKLNQQLIDLEEFKKIRET